MFIKKLSLAVALLTSYCSAQVVGPISITSAQCAQIGTGGQATVAIGVFGTWTGTLQPEGAIQGQTPFNVQVTPSNSSTPQSTITGDGAFVVSVAGYDTLLVCGNTVASGTATVWLVTTAAQLGSTSSGGFTSPLTTKGDIFTFTSVNARLGVGSDGQCLTAQSGQATG